MQVKPTHIWKYTWNSAAPYNAYSLLAVEDVYNFSYGATANNQWIVDTKERKMTIWA